MGALPKRKVSRIRRDRRRAHYLRLDKPSLLHCAKCSKPHLSHHVCPHCGNYKGRQVIEIKEKKKDE